VTLAWPLVAPSAAAEVGEKTENTGEKEERKKADEEEAAPWVRPADEPQYMFEMEDPDRVISVGLKSGRVCVTYGLQSVLTLNSNDNLAIGWNKRKQI
jgi:hypothetical protein